MEKIIKGQLNVESWVERIKLAESLACSGNIFFKDNYPGKIQLYFWTPIDGQPCFRIEIDGKNVTEEDAVFPEEMTLKWSNLDVAFVLHNVTDVTDKVPENLNFTMSKGVRYLNLKD